MDETEIIRQLAVIMGWTDFVPRKRKYVRGYLAKRRPGFARREAVYIGLKETIDFLIRGGHALGISNYSILVTLADGRSACVDSKDREY